MTRSEITHVRSGRTLLPRLAAAVGACALVVGGVGIPAAAQAVPAAQAASAASGAARASSSSVTNLAHLDFLLDSVPLPTGVAGHSTYEQASMPSAEAPWVYANHESDGTFQRVGGGAITDSAKGWYAQGAFDADDIARSAVVYLRDWKQNHTASSREHAFQLLRELTYLQTTAGAHAGDVVLWQQSDGTLNPSAIPADNPNPSDSGNSYWLARTLWALGEGYADFRASDPAFARFLQQRMDLSLTALTRESLSTYGKTTVSNGVRVPTWLVTGSAGATAEAVVGLAAYVTADPHDRLATTALTESANGIQAMAAGGIGRWPFGAILPETTAVNYWHAWSGFAPDALAAASTPLHRPDLLKTADTALSQFTAQLLASGGPDNGLTPTPSDASQIAYGTDSLVESLLDTADRTHDSGLDALAAVAAGWYFGANPANTPVYDPSTGVGVDGISATGVPNPNFGAESTIHTELSMLALDAHPAVRAVATSLTSKTAVEGQSVVEAESGSLTGGATMVTPTTAAVGSGVLSGGAYVVAPKGSTIAITIPAALGPVNVYPVVNRGSAPAGSTVWTADGSRGRRTVLGSTANGGAGPQGIGAAPTLLSPLSLRTTAPTGTTTLTATVTSGSAEIDAVLIQPVISHVGMTGPRGAYDLFVNGSTRTAAETITRATSSPALLSRFDSAGRLVGTSRVVGAKVTVAVPAGGFVTIAAGR